jgi:hypothetical protein
VATILIGWLVIFDFPTGASREIGAFVALIGAIATAGGAGEYQVPRGGSWFPRPTSGPDA